MLTVLNLKTCATCRKARRWLDARGFAYETVDIRYLGTRPELVEQVVDAVGPAGAVNKRSKAWREQPYKPELTRDAAVHLIVSDPRVLKRPIFIRDGDVVLGFDEEAQERLWPR